MKMGKNKKLIEVALPLDEINKAAKREKNIHTGLPSNLHTWWSRKPLGIARAIIFSSLVDDPGEHLPGKKAEKKRKELFEIVSKLAHPNAHSDEKILECANKEILNSNNGVMPQFWDPFCGGGSLPLEALRLGLKSFGSDLNPVAVFLTRVLIELVPKQAFHKPINPGRIQEVIEGLARYDGLKKDVHYYAKIIAGQLEKNIAKYYPEIEIPKHFGGGKGKIAAWIWARTVECPNPSCRCKTPLVNKFWLSTHRGNKAYVVPKHNLESKTFNFSVEKSGQPQEGTVSRSGAICLACDNPVSFDHIRFEGTQGRISYSLMAIAVEGPRGRIYLEPTNEQSHIANSCEPGWEPEADLPESALGFRVQKYGITKQKDLFTKRQLLALSKLSELINEIRDDIIKDANGDIEYANTVQAFLALSLSRVAQTNNTLVRWLIRVSGTSKGTPAFDRQIVSMVWEFSEGNILGNSVGSWKAAIKNPLTALKSIPPLKQGGIAFQNDASQSWGKKGSYVISTDPPYFDAIGYADLSDFFYIWLRRAMRSVHEDIFSTMLVPKTTDLTRDLGRKEVKKNAATENFLTRLKTAFEKMREAANPSVPITVYYAFKQAEVKSLSGGVNGTIMVSTGWETLLESLIRSGFCITGTWPLRTESASRLRAIGSNALAASIVLVCRKRSNESQIGTKSDLLSRLRKELPAALKALQRGNIAPVDLAQASLGPGMAIYTSYQSVIDSSGKAVSVREALYLINQTLDEVLAEQEGDFDSDSRWALAWFEQFGFKEGEFGIAETLSKAKNTSVAGMENAGFLISKGGKVRLLSPEEMATDLVPEKGKRTSIWKTVHQIIRSLELESEMAAAKIVSEMGASSDMVRELAYRLYSLCERKKRSQEAFSYNGLVQSWPEIERLSREIDRHPKYEQITIPGQE